MTSRDYSIITCYITEYDIIMTIHKFIIIIFLVLDYIYNLGHLCQSDLTSNSVTQWQINYVFWLDWRLYQDILQSRNT